MVGYYALGLLILDDFCLNQQDSGIVLLKSKKIDSQKVTPSWLLAFHVT